MEYDLIVIGGGPTGENVADRAVRGGLRVALVESDLVGGECSYWACMPSKALLRPVAARLDARAVGGAAQAVTGPLDAAAVFTRRDGFTSHWRDDGQVEWLEGAHIDLVRGVGRLAGPKQVEVTAPDGGRRTLTARHAVAVCTGTRAAVPDLPGLRAARPWTSRDATSASAAPPRLAVLGGGVVGCEMATAWQALGSQVTMLSRTGLLPRTEPFAGELVARGLTDLGADVRTGVSVTEVHRPDPDGPLTIGLDDGSRVEADELLVAAGREPATADLGLDTLGAQGAALADGWLEVDDTCQVTGVPGGWLYAAGDVNHRALLTHMGKYQGRACGDAIAALARGETVDRQPWSRHTATADHAAVPQVVFTVPEVAAVGLTNDEAVGRGLPVRTVRYDIGAVAGASLYADDYTGQAAIVVDTDREVIVGATFVGPGVAELLHAATIAVVGEVPLRRLWHAVPSYPTISEVWLRLLENYPL